MRRVLWLLKTGEWKTVGGGFDDVNDFVRSLKLGKFKVITDARAEFVQRVKELQPAVSNRALAKAMKVGKGTIDRDARGPNGPAPAVPPPPPPPPPLQPGAADGQRDAKILANRGQREERREEKIKAIRPLALAEALTTEFPPSWF